MWRQLLDINLEKKLVSRPIAHVSYVDVQQASTGAGTRGCGGDLSCVALGYRVPRDGLRTTLASRKVTFARSGSNQ